MSDTTPLDRRAERIRLVRGNAVVEVATGVGGRVASLVVDGWDVVRRDGWTDNEWGIFVMAPWVGRLRDARVTWSGQAWDVPATEPPHALHGLVSRTVWTVAHVDGRSARLESAFGPEWPPGGRLVHELRLFPDRLVLALEVHAESGAVPAITGWHPWFRRRAVRLADGREAEAAELDIRAARRVELDAAGLPTGRLVPPRAQPVDDVLLDVTRPPTVTWPGGPAIEVRAAGAAAWIVYTAHPDGVCVEPVTGLPDGLNGGLLGPPPEARPGAPLRAVMEIAFG